MNFSNIKNIKNLKLVYKLTTAYLLLGLLTVFSIAFVSYKVFEDALYERTFAQLSSINMLKKLQVENYFTNRLKDIRLLANSPEVIESFRQNTPASDSLVKPYLQFYNESFQNQSIALLNKDLKVLSGANPALIKNVLDRVSGSEKFKQFLDKIGDSLNVIDLTTVLSETKKPIVMTGAPVIGQRGQAIGLVLAVNSVENLTSILYERTGMGKSGESYIVGQNYKMRSRSRFYPKVNPVDIEVRTPASVEGMKNIEGVEIIKDYRGIPVLSAFRKLDIPGLDWVILSEIDQNEALRPIKLLQSRIFLITGVVILVFCLITVYIANLISRPIVQLKKLLQKTARGIIPNRTTEPKVYDEIGQMTVAINQLINALRRTSDFAYEIGNGNFEKSYTPLSSEDTLGYSLVQMRDKLKILTENEVRLIKENSLKLMEGQEEERKRISRELHDGIGQLLTTIRFKVGVLKEGSLKTEIRTLLDETISETRRISNNLMPSVLIDFGLEAGLRRLTKQVEEASGVQISLIYEKEDDSKAELPFDVTTNVYRVTQEALNNISKYAKATEAEVAVFVSSENITVEVADNGVGFDKSLVRLGKGLKNMEERVALLNGFFELKSSSTRGTIIFFEIPLSKK